MSEYVKYLNGFAVSVTERDHSPGVFDAKLVYGRSAGQDRGFASDCITASQAAAIQVKVEALKQGEHVLAKLWAIARAKGGEFLVAYEGSGSYPTGTLHRWTCATFSRKFGASEVGNVYDTNLIDFYDQGHATNSGNSYKVCQRCCGDLNEAELVARHKLARNKPGDRQRAYIGAVAKARQEQEAQLAQVATDIEIFLGTGEGKFGLDDEGRVITTLSMLELIRDALVKDTAHDVAEALEAANPTGQVLGEDERAVIRTVQ